MPITHFVTNRSIMLTNEQKIKTNPRGEPTSNGLELQNFRQEIKKNV